MSAARKSFDWQQVKRRLGEAQQALERALEPSAAEMESAWRRRAADLAARRVLPSAAAATTSVLICALGDERYAIELGDLAEILPFAACTRLPGAPPHFLGVVNLRGEILAVADLARLLGLPGGDADAGGYVLLLRQRALGLRVDGIERIQPLAADDLEAAAPGIDAGLAPHVRGVTRDRLIVLSLDSLLDAQLPAQHT